MIGKIVLILEKIACGEQLSTGETGNLCRDFKNPRKDGQLMKKWKLKI